MLRGASVGIPALLAAPTFAGTAPAEEDSEVLDGFRDGVDGWRSPGPYRENRVEVGDAPVVTVGDHALQVPYTESRVGRILNDESVREADLVDANEMAVRLAGTATGTDSPFVVFTRFHYTGQGKGKAGDGGSDDGKGRGRHRGGKPVVDSDPIVVPQRRPQTLVWDLGDLPDRVLEHVRRVEIRWFLAGYPPADGGSRRGVDPDSPRGTVLFDHVRFADDVSDARGSALAEKRRELRRRHGRVTDREVVTERVDLVHERQVRRDGTEVHHAVVYHDDPATLDEGEVPRVTHFLDGDRFALGGEQR